MPLVDRPYSLPDRAVAFEAAAKSDLPNPVSLPHALQALNVCQHIPGTYKDTA